MFGLGVLGNLGLSGGLLDPAPWVLSSGGVKAALDVDFANNLAWSASATTTVGALLACTRASAGYYLNADGTLTSFANDTLRTGTNGLLDEDTRTNVVLWNRDLTNAAWTKSNCTAAKNQTGADGTANAASSLTATAGNGTALQAITLGSSARYQSAWVKRITGTGTINMTMDNGSTWTAITVTASYTQLTIPTQTLANPTVGFRIVTNGDAIAVDLVQNENGAFPTTPIATTTVAVARSADRTVFSTIAWLNAAAGSPGTVVVQATAPPSTSPTGAVIALQNNALSNRIVLYRGGTTPTLLVNSGSDQDNPSGGSWSASAVGKIGVAFANQDWALSFNGGSIQASSTSNVPAMELVSVGSWQDASSIPWYGYIKRISYWPTRLSNAALQTLTT